MTLNELISHLISSSLLPLSFFFQLGEVSLSLSSLRKRKHALFPRHARTLFPLPSSTNSVWRNLSYLSHIYILRACERKAASCLPYYYLPVVGKTMTGPDRHFAAWHRITRLLPAHTHTHTDIWRCCGDGDMVTVVVVGGGGGSLYHPLAALYCIPWRTPCRPTFPQLPLYLPPVEEALRAPYFVDVLQAPSSLSGVTAALKCFSFSLPPSLSSHYHTLYSCTACTHTHWGERAQAPHLSSSPSSGGVPHPTCHPLLLLLTFFAVPCLCICL